MRRALPAARAGNVNDSRTAQNFSPLCRVWACPQWSPHTPGVMRSAEQPTYGRRRERLRCIPREPPELAERPVLTHVSRGSSTFLPVCCQGEQLGRKMPSHRQRQGDPALTSPRDALTFGLEWSFLKAEDFKFPLNAVEFPLNTAVFWTLWRSLLTCCATAVLQLCEIGISTATVFPPQAKGF